MWQRLRPVLGVVGIFLAITVGFAILTLGNRSDVRENCERVNDVRKESNARGPQHRKEARIIAETETLFSEFVSAAADARQQSGDFATAAHYRRIQERAAVLRAEAQTIRFAVLPLVDCGNQTRLLNR